MPCEPEPLVLRFCLSAIETSLVRGALAPPLRMPGLADRYMGDQGTIVSGGDEKRKHGLRVIKKTAREKPGPLNFK
jgi:hypothetical protein